MFSPSTAFETSSPRAGDRLPPSTTGRGVHAPRLGDLPINRWCSPQRADEVPVNIGPNMWIRKERRVRRFSRFAVCYAFAMLRIPLWLFSAPHSHWHNTVPNDLGIGLFFVAVAAPGLWTAPRLRRTGLWIGVDGVRVRNPLRTYTLALSDAESFAARVLAGGNNGTPCPMLKQTHGRAVGVWALGREGVIWRYARYAVEMEPLCDELNDVPVELKGGGVATTPAPAR